MADTAAGRPKASFSYTAWLSLGALGVVFGDIGTSPLYALREALSEEVGLELGRATAMGIASLMFWSMVAIVTLKYIVLVMRADNDGEGGLLALTALITPMSNIRRHPRRAALVGLGLFGTALLYGDGIITPAISVLSAVEGLQVAAPALSEYVLPISTVIIVGLFSIQRRGTGAIGSLFGPVMIVWFTVLAVLGLTQIARDPGVLTALSPVHAISLFGEAPGAAFRSLGAVFLVVTGSEALYADMGHFGRRAIRIGWFGLVLPALTLNYLGQAALVSATPEAADNPFFRLGPDWSTLPLVVLATLATVIASQALITGAYSLTMQAVQLGYLPRVDIDHTSPREIGQIYIGSVNWALMAACVAVVWAFGSSGALAAAYGVAVTSTMVVTTVLLAVVMRTRWGWNRLVVGAVIGAMMVVDVAFLGANLLKIAQGGWFPIAVGAVVFAVMTTWRGGRNLLARHQSAAHLPVERFVQSIVEHPQQRVPGTAVYLERQFGMTPPALLANLRAHEVLHETVVVVTVRVIDVPHVPGARRATVHEMGEEINLITLTYGFMQEVDVPQALANIVHPTFGFDLSDATFFLGKESVIVAEDAGWSHWRERLYAVMHRNASSAARHFRLPLDRVVEVGTPVEL